MKNTIENLNEQINRLELLNKSLAKEIELLNEAVNNKEVLYQNALNELEDINNKLQQIYNSKFYKIYTKLRRVVRGK